MEKVLQFAKLDKGELMLQKESVNIDHLLKELKEAFLLQLHEKGASLSLFLDSEYSTIMADPIHVKNIFSNLIDNAIKFSEKRIFIDIKTTMIEQNIVIFVCDDGIGIKKEDQDKIFDKFYRVHTGNIHDVKGFGLGLSYVKEMLEMHGGSIELTSELNKGSIFKVTLPLLNVKEQIA